jgi:hypothetical protein
MPNVLVNAQKCFVGLAQNESVFIHRTDSSGLTTGNFEAETALYQFFITNQSNTLLSVTPCSKIVPQTTPYTLLFQVGAEYNSPFLDVRNLTDITESLVFNKSSGTFTLTYSDTSSDFSYAELYIYNLNQSGRNNREACYSNSTLPSAIITCNVSADGTYTAQAYIFRSSGILIDQIIATVESVSSTVGYAGAFLGFFIILVCAFAFKFNEIAGIWLVTVAIVIINYIGLIAFGNVFVTALIGVAVILTAVLER